MFRISRIIFCEEYALDKNKHTENQNHIKFTTCVFYIGFYFANETVFILPCIMIAFSAVVLTQTGACVLRSRNLLIYTMFPRADIEKTATD